MKLELHQLEEKYAGLRVRDAARERRLAASLVEHGQQAPVVVTQDGERYVLLDGYARVGALRSLGRDLVDAVLLALPEAEALVLSHRLDNTRRRSALEEGWMLRVLVDEHGLRPGELAEKLDRSESWVSRRLALVRTLPTSVQRAVGLGRIPAQAAQKSLVPLARANAAQCEQLVAGLGRRGASVRELARLYEAWRRADGAGRERLVRSPRLFLEAEAAAREATPEPAATDDVKALMDMLGGIAGLCRRACGRLVHGMPVPKNRREEHALRGAWAGARAAIAALCAHLDDDDEQENRDDAGSRDEDRGPQAARRGPRVAGDREGAECVARCGPQGAGERPSGGPGAGAA